MAGPSAIEWTERTWNPVRGCTRVSPGCGGPGPHGGCYAEGIAARFSKPGQAYHGLAEMRGGKPRWTGNLSFGHDLDAPLRWRKPCRIFVNSMSDLFHEDLPTPDIATVYAICIVAHHMRGHTLQILTKRANRMRRVLNDPAFWTQVNSEVGRLVLEHSDPLDRRTGDLRSLDLDYGPDRPPPHIWLGVSVEDQARADERVNELRATPASVRFISAEPLLGRVDFARIRCPNGCPPPDYCNRCHPDGGTAIGTFDALSDGLIHLIIVGLESGPLARFGHPQWVRDIRDACAEHGVSFFFKQWGEWKPISEMSEREVDVLYRSNLVAKPGENQGTLDDIYGRTCKVPTASIGYGGARGFDAFYSVHGHGGMTLFRVGKKAAGRTLDGVEHDAMPEVDRG